MKKASPKAKRSHKAGGAATMTSAGRKVQLNQIVAKARDAGETIPAGIKLISFRKLTGKERAYGKHMEALARVGKAHAA